MAASWQGRLLGAELLLLLLACAAVLADAALVCASLRCVSTNLLPPLIIGVSGNVLFLCDFLGGQGPTLPNHAVRKDDL